MKKDTNKSINLNAGSWRDIKQSASRKAVTDLARKRQMKTAFRAMGICLGIVILGAATVFSYNIYSSKKNSISLSRTSEPLRQILYETDGVLSHEWLRERVSLKKGLSLMEVDIYAIKEALGEEGQVKTVAVTRKFPDSLHIKIEERRPVLRARVSKELSASNELLVDEEGVVYEGKDYHEATLKSLPYLGGVRFTGDGDGIKPVRGLPTVSKLLIYARAQYPDIYEDWRIVSCENFDGKTKAPEALIVMKGRYVKQAVFAPYDFEDQLSQLDQILEYSRRNSVNALKRVDLSLGEQVAVQYFPEEKPRL